MAVDHGLGGRESDKSRRKRARKAARDKKTIQLATSRALEKDDAAQSKRLTNAQKSGTQIIFSEESRAAWVSGFKQRKKIRRQYGVAMQVMCFCHVRTQ